jgi:hypothetical protein
MVKLQETRSSSITRSAPDGRVIPTCWFLLPTRKGRTGSEGRTVAKARHGRCRYKGFAGMPRWPASASSPTIWSTSGSLSRRADNRAMRRPSASPRNRPGPPLVIICGQFVIDRSPEQAAVPRFALRHLCTGASCPRRVPSWPAASDRRNERDDPADSVPAVGQKAARARERKRSPIAIRAT